MLVPVEPLPAAVPDPDLLLLGLELGLQVLVVLRPLVQLWN